MRTCNEKHVSQNPSILRGQPTSVAAVVVAVVNPKVNPKLVRCHNNHNRAPVIYSDRRSSGKWVVVVKRWGKGEVEVDLIINWK